MGFMIKAIGNKILLKIELVSEEKSAGGLVIVHKESKMNTVGTIIDIGPSVDTEFHGVKIGDKILYENYAGKVLDDDGTQYIMIKEEEMCAKVT